MIKKEKKDLQRHYTLCILMTSFLLHFDRTLSKVVPNLKMMALGLPRILFWEIHKIHFFIGKCEKKIKLQYSMCLYFLHSHSHPVIPVRMDILFLEI